MKFQFYLKRFLKLTLPDSEEKKFIKFAKKLKKNKYEKSILVEAPESNFFWVKNFFIATYLSDKYKLSIKYYLNRNNLKNYKSFLSNIYFKIRNSNLFNASNIKKYNSFCENEYFSLTSLKKRNININYPKKIDAFVKFKYRGIIIGDLIIDSYLYHMHNFLYENKTQNLLKENNFRQFFNETINIVDNFHNFFEKNKVKILVNTYSSYIDHGIACRIAEKKNLYIYYVCDSDTPFIKKKSSNHKRNYKLYKKEFFQLKNKEEKIKITLEILHSRFKGVIDENYKYMKNNYYKKSDERIINNGLKTICIFAHSTTDSLFGFDKMNFYQQKDWIIFTINNLKNYKKNYNIFLKIHPNETKKGEIFLRSIVKSYNFIKILDKDVNNTKIINSDLVYGVTVHGTIGLELAYYGIPTIYANKGPYTSFSFAQESKSINDYKKKLISCLNKKKNKYYKKEAAIFYYMNFINKKNKEYNKTILNMQKYISYDQFINLKKFTNNLNLSSYYKAISYLSKNENNLGTNN